MEVTSQVQNSSTYRMRVKENIRITDPDCKDTVIHLALEPLRGQLASFTPGQYVRIGIPKVNDPAPGYFAIASCAEEPGGYEFFIKDAGPLSAYRGQIEAGALLELEAPYG